MSVLLSAGSVTADATSSHLECSCQDVSVVRQPRCEGRPVIENVLRLALCTTHPKQQQNDSHRLQDT